jgi:putative hydrolase of the HAD superfamily
MFVIKGIGFDLFGTLVLQERFRFDQCLEALYQSLRCSGFHLDRTLFVQTYREVNRRLMAQAMAEGRESHNRLWVAGTLQALGHTAVAADDACVARAVDAYFEPFIESCQLIPGTRQMLATLAGRYRLAVVSNFTHPPAFDRILDRLDIRGCFEAVVVSGRLGLRKPHPGAFAALTHQLGLPAAEILFVGDELEADIIGARRAGMRTAWMTYRQRLERPSPLAEFLGFAEAAGGVRPDHIIGSWTELLALLGETPGQLGGG